MYSDSRYAYVYSESIKFEADYFRRIAIFTYSLYLDVDVSFGHYFSSAVDNLRSGKLDTPLLPADEPDRAPVQRRVESGYVLANYDSLYSVYQQPSFLLFVFGLHCKADTYDFWVRRVLLLTVLDKHLLITLQRSSFRTRDAVHVNAGFRRKLRREFYLSVFSVKLLWGLFKHKNGRL